MLIFWWGNDKLSGKKVGSQASCWVTWKLGLDPTCLHKYETISHTSRVNLFKECCYLLVIKENEHNTYPGCLEDVAMAILGHFLSTGLPDQTVGGRKGRGVQEHWAGLQKHFMTNGQSFSFQAALWCCTVKWTIMKIIISPLTVNQG